MWLTVLQSGLWTSPHRCVVLGFRVFGFTGLGLRISSLGFRFRGHIDSVASVQPCEIDHQTLYKGENEFQG